MQVLFNLPVNNNKNDYHRNIYNYPTFKMKMNELKGVDQFVAKKYKINPQPIKTLEKFQEHCKELAAKIKGNNFLGRREETKIQRKAMIEDWYKYITEENGAYTGAMILMIISGITAGLKPKEDTLPPVLNKGVLADTVEQIKTNMPENPDDNAVSFNKQYRLNLQKTMMAEGNALNESLNGWIEIPSKKHDPENFEANVDKLKMLSHDSWCTKSFNARPYLSEGDFHVYMENGKPKLGVRFWGDEIQEIQGEKNNSKIPVKYGDIAKEHIKDYKLTSNANRELQVLDATEAEIEKIKALFPNGMNNASTQEILEVLGIRCKKDEDGFLTISHYKDMTNDNISFNDLEIDENRLFKDIKVIEGYADFKDSQITSLGNLQTIGGYAKFRNSKITDLGNLQSIGSDADFRDSKITNLGNLQSIGGYADFRGSQITDLGNLQSIGGEADFSNSQMTSLGNLQFIGGSAYFRYSQITDLGNLQSIGGEAVFRDSKITSLGNLKSIGGAANFSMSQITSLGNLQTIGGDADFRDSKITDLGNLQTIGGYAYFDDSPITCLGNLQFIGGNAYFRDSQITDLGNLQSIGGYAYFNDSKITSLGKLQSIGGSVFVTDSKLSPDDFSNVKVGGNITQ